MTRNARTVGERIEQLLAGLHTGRDRQAAEELVRLLVEMYGQALGTIVAALGERDTTLVERLAEDELVGSLLLLHDLHPLDVDTRIQHALDRVRPYLGSHAGDVEYLGVDGSGVAQLRLAGNCHGCPSSTVTVQTAIEGAVQDAAPEITGVEVAGMTEEPVTLLQIGKAPPPGWGADPGWTPLPELGPPTGRPVRVELDGVPVLVCALRGTLYAYHDACAACEASLVDSTVDNNVLTCSHCGHRFDIRAAGRSLDSPTRHLDPLPLLSDSHGTRISLPRAVAS